MTQRFTDCTEQKRACPIKHHMTGAATERKCCLNTLRSNSSFMHSSWNKLGVLLSNPAIMLANSPCMSGACVSLRSFILHPQQQTIVYVLVYWSEISSVNMQIVTSNWYDQENSAAEFTYTLTDTHARTHSLTVDILAALTSSNSLVQWQEHPFPRQKNHKKWKEKFISQLSHWDGTQESDALKVKWSAYVFLKFRKCHSRNERS